MKTKEQEKLTITDAKLKYSMTAMIEKIDELGLQPSETAVIAIGRGGFVPAQYTAYSLDITDIYSIQSVLYDDENTQKKTQHISGIYSIPYGEYKNFLVVDDIYDSGTTLDNVVDILESAADDQMEVYTDKRPSFIPCVIYTHKKKKKMRKKGIIFGRKIKKVNGILPWLTFPWDQLIPNASVIK